MIFPLKSNVSLSYLIFLLPVCFRLLQSHYSSKPMDVQNSLSVTKQYFGQQNQVVASTDRIKEYLISLNQGEPTHTESLCVAAEREENSKGDGSNQREQCVEMLPHHQDHHHHHHPNLSFSEDVPPCEAASVWSNWSMKSESTFNTRDEAAFRDGLAALDASIVNLQKTIQLDLRKWPVGLQVSTAQCLTFFF